jgi:hypothetical protein
MKRLLKRLLPLEIIDYLRKYRIRFLLKSSRRTRDAIGQVDDYWRPRIEDVRSAPDNQLIPRNKDAGVVKNYYVTMHNGVKVCANGYYGSGMLNLLIENKGVHEPQEELIFETIIRSLPEHCTMLELGAYWGFYSLSLLQLRPKADCFLVEPSLQNLISGQINFQLNGRKGHFTRAGIADKTQGNAVISVDAFCQKKQIQHLDILHSDIQGYELAMLSGAESMLSEKKIDYLFISTHSDELHRDCIAKLKDRQYRIVESVNLKETYSHDGLIVAIQPDLPFPGDIKVSKKNS